jgi:uncharacterized protein YceK
MKRRLLLTLILAAALSGCGTLFDTLGEERRGRRRGRDGITTKLYGGEIRIYGGVRWDIERIVEAKAGWLLAVFALDAPISLALDTVLLPFTITWNLID